MSVQSKEIHFFGERILLRTEEGQSTMQEAIEIVESKIRESESKVKNPQPHHVALLALLDLAGDFIKARDRLVEYQAQMDQTTKELLSLIEAQNGENHGKHPGAEKEITN